MSLRHIFALLVLLFEGCAWDPLGGCSAESLPTSNLDEGCAIDPLGGCRG
jgi:hypothetical protein